MLVDLLKEGSRTAGTATVLLCLACMSTGTVALLLSSSPQHHERSRAALRLSRILALTGGSIGLAGALAAVPYRYLVGDVAARTALLAELLLLGIVAVWAVLAAAVLLRASRETDRR